MKIEPDFKDVIRYEGNLESVLTDMKMSLNLAICNYINDYLFY